MPRKTKPTPLTLLGRSEATLPASPGQARLETFPNPARRRYRIHFETDDFTSLCPVTGQADFARIEIDYVPDRFCVESKSLKFYLASYRGERAFNEAVTNRILDDFVKACAPREAIVTAQFSARGGIALSVRVEYPDNSARDSNVRPARAEPRKKFGGSAERRPTER
ncbi:MAG: preQ(1) synthase [Chthoniobacterales bacterium]